MTNARDLSELIYTTMDDTDGKWAEWSDRIADAVVAAGWRPPVEPATAHIAGPLVISCGCPDCTRPVTALRYIPPL